MNDAVRFVEDKFAECLPPKINLPFEVLVAHWTGKKEVTAKVKLFNGDEALIKVNKGHFTHVEWLEMDRDFFWDNGKWITVEKEGAE